MANELRDPYINPLKFHELDAVRPESYVSRFMDDWAFRRTIQPFDQDVCFFQPWHKSDSIPLQYTSNFGPITLRLYNEEGILQNTWVMTTGLQNELQPAFFLRTVSMALAAFPAGKYFFSRTAASQVTYSEPFELFDNPANDDLYLDIEPSIYIEYAHFEPYGGVKFKDENSFRLAIRVPGWLKYKITDAEDTIYKDQLLNQSMIRSIPFRVHNFILAGMGGVPPWFVDKISRICGCSYLAFDGRLMAKSDEGGPFEPVEVDRYPMAGYSRDMVEKLNRDSVITQNDVIIEGIAAAALIIDNAGFGMSEQAGYSEIIHLQ